MVAQHAEPVPPSGRAAGQGLALADIACEQAFLLGAGSTVLYQLAVPGVGLGVAEHSTTLQRPVDRLRTTLLYIYMMVLGTDEERQAITRMVNRMHGPVTSPGRYSAFDPTLQLWVAATLNYNGPVIYQRIFGPLDQASLDRIYREGQVIGNALQVKPEQWPATWAEFVAYWHEQLATLEEADPVVKRYVRQLLSTEGQPLVVRPLLWLQGLMTRGNVEPELRAAFDLPWSAWDQRLYDLFWTVFPPLYRLTPRVIRQAPGKLLVRNTRRRLRRGTRVI